MSDAGVEAARKLFDEWWTDSDGSWTSLIALVAAHTEAALLADRLARHDETVAAIEAAVKEEEERISQLERNAVYYEEELTRLAAYLAVAEARA